MSAPLLGEVMEAREQIGDPDTPVAALLALRARARAAVAACERDLASAFAEGALARAREVTVALQYYSKIDDEAGVRLEATPAAAGDADGGGASLR